MTDALKIFKENPNWETELIRLWKFASLISIIISHLIFLKLEVIKVENWYNYESLEFKLIQLLITDFNLYNYTS